MYASAAMSRSARYSSPIHGTLPTHRAQESRIPYRPMIYSCIIFCTIHFINIHILNPRSMAPAYKSKCLSLPDKYKPPHELLQSDPRDALPPPPLEHHIKPNLPFPNVNSKLSNDSRLPFVPLAPHPQTRSCRPSSSHPRTRCRRRLRLRRLWLRIWRRILESCVSCQLFSRTVTSVYMKFL